MNIVLFEDERVEQLYPITLSRPGYAVTCGSMRLLDLALQLDGTTLGKVRSYLSKTQQDYFSQSHPEPNAPTLWLNAQLVPDSDVLEVLRTLVSNAEPFYVEVDDRVAAAWTPEKIEYNAELPANQVADFLKRLSLPVKNVDLRLFNLPHSVIAENLDIARRNVEFLANSGHYKQAQDGVFIASDCSIHEMVAFNTASGPIVIDEGVTINAFAALNGPLYIGKNTTIASHTLLKGPVTIGHTCKVGGEVSSAIIEPLTNKSHFGYLGTSYVGSWVNLGAGTTNSNLKNTYGSVRVEYEAGKCDTGMQFMGCVIGDYSKTAIHTSIFTGKIIGVCSNVYGTVTKNVPSFANYARSLGEVTEHSADVMEVTHKRILERRGLEQLDRHRQLIRDMYAIESPKRKLANKPLTL